MLLMSIGFQTHLELSLLLGGVETNCSSRPCKKAACCHCSLEEWKHVSSWQHPDGEDSCHCSLEEWKRPPR